MNEEWQGATLGDVLVRVRRPVAVEDGVEYPAVSVLRDGQGLGVKEPFKGGATNYSTLFQVRDGDVVVRTITAFESPVAVAGPDHDAAHVSQVFLTYEVEKRALPTFLALYFQTPVFWQEMRNRAQGTVLRRKTISDNAFRAIPLHLPPLSVQQRIVDLMEHLDNQVNLLQAGASTVRALYNSLGEELISGWPLLLVKDLAETPRGLVGGPFGSDLTTKDYRDSGVPVIRGTNMSCTGRFIGGEFAFVSQDKADSLRRNAARAGDVIFTQRGTLGQVALVPPTHESFVVSQSQMRLRPDPQIASPEFVFHAFSRPSMVAAIKGRNTATANPHINLGILAGLGIPVPELGRQQEIATLLDKVLDLEDAFLQEAKAASAMRATTLSELLSGALDIPETYDELLGVAS